MCAEVEGPRNLPSRPGEAGNQRRAGSVTTPGGQDGWALGRGCPRHAGCGLRARGWGENQTLAEGRNWGRRSDTPEAGLTQRDDPCHATRPSFPRGLGCVREVALLALRKSKRLPTPEAFRPPQSLKKFISHHRGRGGTGHKAGNLGDTRLESRRVLMSSRLFRMEINHPLPPHTHFSLCFASEFLRDLLLPSAVREQTAEP